MDHGQMYSGGEANGGSAQDSDHGSGHCHKSHHTMNAMGHQVPDLIGVPQKDLAKLINKLVPDYMAMGSTGGSMGGMEMPLPDNTRPMMTGTGPFGALEMGGTFSVVKVREGVGAQRLPRSGVVQASQRDGGL